MRALNDDYNVQAAMQQMEHAVRDFFLARAEKEISEYLHENKPSVEDFGEWVDYTFRQEFRDEANYDVYELFNNFYESVEWEVDQLMDEAMEDYENQQGEEN